MESTALDSASLGALALFGKTAAALLLVLGLIFLCSWLLKRCALLRRLPAATPRLRVIASTAVGARERVVIVAVDDRQLLLGVAPGHITKLHELAAPGTFATALATQRDKAQSAPASAPREAPQP
jgi:flagellar protein FliO/FliZ